MIYLTLLLIFPIFCFSYDQSIKEYCNNGIFKYKECMKISNSSSEFYFYMGKYHAYKEMLDFIYQANSVIITKPENPAPPAT